MANKKITFLIVLALVALISLTYGILTPSKARQRAAQAAQKEKTAAVQPDNESVKVLTAEERYPKRGSYSEWGKSPFMKPEAAQEKAPLSDLVLGGIVWDAFSPKAVINDTIVVVGDEIEGRKVVAINPESVILTDGAKETRLGLETLETKKK